jgi:CheY-like chemotaxis protein/HD-like signal output (HDOD) protein
MTMSRVLFVDDEPRILDGLRRSLRGRRGVWDMQFAGGGAEALELMAAGEFDVIVSDMLMPGMDGADLLTAVGRDHPGVARVVLSGHIEPDAVIKVALAGHRFLTKPSDLEHLVDVIEQLLDRAPGAHRDTARRIAGTVRCLPATPGEPPAVDALLRPDADLDTAVRAATHDVGLAAKLLQLSTSRFFGAPPRNSSVESIVAAMGVPMVQRVAAATAALWPANPWQPGTAELVAATWRHAVATAALVEQVASPASRPYAHAAALLQDVGRFVCLAAPGAGLDVAAGTYDGARFRDVGVELLCLWGVPPPVVAAVAHRDTPQQPDPTGLGVTAAVRAAHLLLQQTGAADPGSGGHPEELASLLAHPQLAVRGIDWRTAADEAAWRAAGAAPVPGS